MEECSGEDGRDNSTMGYWDKETRNTIKSHGTDKEEQRNKQEQREMRPL